MENSTKNKGPIGKFLRGLVGTRKTSPVATAIQVNRNSYMARGSTSTTAKPLQLARVENNQNSQINHRIVPTAALVNG